MYAVETLSAEMGVVESGQRHLPVDGYRQRRVDKVFRDNDVVQGVERAPSRETFVALSVWRDWDLTWHQRICPACGTIRREKVTTIAFQFSRFTRTMDSPVGLE